MMKVILKSNVINVGQRGEVKTVSSGFARNYLIPNNLVVEANEKNLNILKREREEFEKHEIESINKANEISDKMKVSKFVAKVKVGENGKIFGSITTLDIEKIFNNCGFEIKRHNIFISTPIKKTGSYDITVKIHPKVVTMIKLFVLNEKE
ncbi:MAG: 50S ribosomal protein L9 [Endomicrobium sp.]|jgi:large subunit ribosomal protein L9|nr:50S ribosomal protein L9 [Endomicrobium sp.]